MTMAEKNTEAKVDVKPEATAAIEKREERRLRRWDPFEMFDDLQEEMARLWGQAFPLMPRPVSRPLRRLALAPTTWTPSVDVYEKDGKVVVKAELPGMKKEDIEVALDQGDLLIRGERKAEGEVKEENYYRVERTYGSFYRRIPLPFEVKPDQITASYTDGVLEVRIPKPVQEQSQPQPQMHHGDERTPTRRILDRRAEGRRLGRGLEALDDTLQPRPVEADHHLTAGRRRRRAAHHLLGRRVVAADVAFLIGGPLRAKELRSLRDRRQYGQVGVV